MKKFLLAICLLLAACSHEEEKHQPKIISRKELDPQPAPTPAPINTNPFEKSVAPPPVVFQTPTFQEATEIKMNESWTVFVWRDAPNNVTCYFYCIKDSTQNGISCVKN